MNLAERDIQARIMMAISKAGGRVFRNNSGVGWAGKSQRITKPTTVVLMPGDVVVRQARPLHAGLGVGSPDLVGWTPGGVFLGIEVKTAKGRATEAQDNWGSLIRSFGGRSGICRSEDEAVRLMID